MTILELDQRILRAVKERKHLLVKLDSCNEVEWEWAVTSLAEELGAFFLSFDQQVARERKS
jgi:hypothetical protein